MSMDDSKKTSDDQHTPESDTMEKAEGSRETVEAELGHETEPADTTTGGAASPEDREPAEGGRETVESELEDGNDK
ncbi:hypothetical protein [Flaviflexus huanghaiensis]|uniref:hypothetical protein n=1 Tax=Flaviflexus huanghaiensis TaxID=1111473 RepID=UPI0015FB9F2F|nr:hypothetical protein [Flaviflexus huanghaiensis]